MVLMSQKHTEVALKHLRTEVVVLSATLDIESVLVVEGQVITTREGVVALLSHQPKHILRGPEFSPLRKQMLQDQYQWQWMHN
jgi:hypothetical protein